VNESESESGSDQMMREYNLGVRVGVMRVRATGSESESVRVAVMK